VVKAPARLHLGLIDLSGDVGRIYGSVGVAIREPIVEVEAKPHKKLEVFGRDVKRARNVAEKVLKHYGITGGVLIKVNQTIPMHVGLGSTTQLSLAVASSLTRLFKLKASVNELARLLKRGAISGIGTAVFERGGFIVDGGKREKSSEIPPVIFRHSFPEDWTFVVAIPNVRRGLTEKEEASAFRKVSPNPRVAEKISRLLLMRMLPGLVERDIVSFGEALTEIQRLVGSYFISIQGGVFCHPVVSQCVELMLKEGAYGAGQSSWGPTTYGLVNEESKADALKDKLERMLSSVGGMVFCTKADNVGARVEERIL
jgi:beta-RFAP synthase